MCIKCLCTIPVFYITAGQSDNTAAIIGGVVAVIVVVAVTIIMIAFFITRSHRAKFSVPQDVG